MESLDNAGVYRLNNRLALIQTIDFFTPIVDDPYSFGQIAVTNSLSDIYTMGGKPLTAMNIVCFPSKSLDISILQSILLGGAEKLREADVVLIGGHSVEDKELKYGLSVTGIVKPEKLITNSGAQAGDRLILTKPLGIGIISTAMKASKAPGKTIKEITDSMSLLNKKASELMITAKAHSCTDITGFGLIGHAFQMAQNSNICLKINSNKLPLFTQAVEFAKIGFSPGGTQRNKDFYMKFVVNFNKLPDYIIELLFDPQTSGGLLISVSAKVADKLLSQLIKAGYKYSAIIGEVIEKPVGKIILT